VNAGAAPFEITHGMRIAQMVVAAAPQVSFEIARMLDTTDRASGGFGSTGES
jgi:dUTP pyrophosphatase